MSRADANIRMSASSTTLGGSRRSGRGLTRLSVGTSGPASDSGAFPPKKANNGQSRKKISLERNDSGDDREFGPLSRGNSEAQLLGLRSQRLSPKQQKLLTASLIFKSPVSSPVTSPKRLESFSCYSVLAAINSDQKSTAVKTGQVGRNDSHTGDKNLALKSEEERLGSNETANELETAASQTIRPISPNNNDEEETEVTLAATVSAISDQGSTEVAVSRAIEELERSHKRALVELITERDLLSSKVEILEQAVRDEHSRVERLQKGFDDEIEKTNTINVPEIEQAVEQLHAIAKSDAARMTEMSQVNAKLSQTKYDKDKEWLMELREQLQATIVRYDAEQASTSKRMEEFARTSFEDKKRLQSELDSTRQLLTHVKLSLSESQRTVEALQNKEDERNKRIAAHGMLGSGASNNRSRIAPPTLAGLDGVDNTSEERQQLEDRIEYLERQLAEQVSRVEDQATLILGKEVEVSALTDLVKKHVSEHGALKDALTQSRNKVKELETKVSTLEVVAAKEREMNLNGLGKRDTSLKQLREELAAAKAASEQAAQEAQFELGRALRDGQDKYANLEQNLESAKSTINSRDRRLFDLEASEAGLRQNVSGLTKQVEDLKSKLGESERAHGAARAGTEARNVQLEHKVRELEQTKIEHLRDIMKHTDDLKRERVTSTQLKREAEQLSLELSQVRERQHSLLSEEREMFQGKILELEAALHNRDGGVTEELERMSKLVIEYQQSQSQLQSRLEATEKQLNISKQEMTELQSESNASSAFAEEARRILRVKEEKEHIQSQRLESAQRDVKTLEDFVQVRLGSSLSDMNQAQEAMEAEMTCMSCLEMFNKPVLVLPGETRCCQRCVSEEASTSEHFTVFTDAAMDALTTKVAFSRRALATLKKEVTKMEARRKSLS